MLRPMLQAIMLVTALSMDAFVASFAYGTNKIRIPFLSVTVINVICAAILAVALFAGSAVKQYVPEAATTLICFLILLVVGGLKLFDGFLKNYINRSGSGNRSIEFKLFDFNFVLSIYADSTKADIDNSRELSPREATYLAMALALDGLAAGFGSGLTDINYLQVVLFSLISDMVAVMLGSMLGRKVAANTNLDLSWLGGLILIALAFMKLR